jgi:hypothetical protein
LPRLRHCLERARAENGGVDRHAAPAEDAKTLGVGRGFYRAARVGGCARREKGEAQAEVLGKIDGLLGGARAKKSLGDRGKQTGAIAASAIGIDTAPVRQSFERIERVLNDVAARRTGELRNKTRSTGIVVRVAPVGVLAPTSLLPLVAQRHKSLWFSCAHVVQLRFFIRQNDFLEGEALKMRDGA